MPKLKPPARLDFLALAAHDPSILTFRHCTGDDIRRLAPLVPMPLWRARRAFALRLFYHPRYLALSLDPAFEPQEPIRLRAKLMLDQKLRYPPKCVKPAKATSQKSPSKLTRYAFD